LRLPQIINLGYLDMQLKSLIFLASSIAFCLGATPQGVESDLDNILSQVNTLDNDIVAFPDSGGSLVNALVCNFRFCIES